MRPYMLNIFVTLLVSLILCGYAVPGMALTGRALRLGYLDSPESALCRIASQKGHFREEGLQVELVKYSDSGRGLEALESGAIDVGVFAVGESLRAIAGGKNFRIIAGGGTPIQNNPLSELDDSLQAENESRGVLVLIPPTWPNAEKGTIIQLTAALIRAYRTHRQHAHSEIESQHSRNYRGVHFDPNPDYWRLERIWRSLGLQDVAMKRDFLASHVYEEIYCDALDRLLLGHIDPILQQLFSKAICTPNCCPASASKL
jgi:hypothetical protein